ncbi:MAG TPA: phospholipase D-like domain-containing protein [Nocardioides sp.]|jgi:phosphatidylserine/phosphatidylglycerophosphate/cardiolipin synthase-like enzyme
MADAARERAISTWFQEHPRRGPARPVHLGNEVAAYIDYDRYYSAAAAAVEAAGSGAVVFVAGHELVVDTPVTVAGREDRFGDVLARAGARGAEVRLLLSGHLGNVNGPAVAWFKGRPGCVALLDDRLRLPGTFHQKAVVTLGSDRAVAFVGGMDIATSRLARPQLGEGPWHDVQVKVIGGAAYDVFDTFFTRWNSHLDGRRQPIAARLRQRDDRRPLRAVQVVRTYGNPTTGTTLLALDPRRQRSDFADVMDQVRHPPFAFAPQGESGIHDALVQAIRATRETIYVEEQYLVASAPIGGRSELLDALAETVARPTFKHLLILTCGVGTVQRELYQTNSHRRALWQKIAAAHPDRVSAWTYKDGQDRCYWVHSKAWLFDDTHAIIGSANFNRRGLTHDGELAVAVMDAEPGGTWVRDLRVALWLKHLPTHTRPVRADDVRDFETGRKLWVENDDTLLRRLDLVAGDPAQPDGLVVCDGKPPDGRWGRLKRTIVCDLGPSIGGKSTRTPEGQWDLAIDPDGT